jgi:hypothetical protein
VGAASSRNKSALFLPMGPVSRLDNLTPSCSKLNTFGVKPAVPVSFPKKGWNRRGPPQ